LCDPGPHAARRHHPPSFGNTGRETTPCRAPGIRIDSRKRIRLPGHPDLFWGGRSWRRSRPTTIPNTSRRRSISTILRYDTTSARARHGRTRGISCSAAGVQRQVGGRRLLSSAASSGYLMCFRTPTSTLRGIAYYGTLYLAPHPEDQGPPPPFVLHMCAEGSLGAGRVNELLDRRCHPNPLCDPKYPRCRPTRFAPTGSRPREPESSGAGADASSFSAISAA